MASEATHSGPCDVNAILASITRQFANASPCEDSLLELIPVFWDLVGAEACYSAYIRMLLTKRETVLALMGCEVNSVDSYDKHRVMDAVTVSDTVSKLRTQSQATANSARFVLGHGETRYDENSRAFGFRNMDRHGRQTEVGDGLSNYRDDGRGSGFNNSAAFNEIDAVDTEVVQDQAESGSQDTGYRQDCNYEYSQNTTTGEQGSIIVAIAGITTNTSEWRKYAFTRAQDNEASNYIRNYARSRDVLDERRGQGSHGWGNSFQADVEWHERDYEVRRGRDRTDTLAHSESHAAGDGDGMSEDKVESRSASQASNKAEYTSNTKRTHNSVDTVNVIDLKNSQRFRNLMLMYDQLTEQIELAKKRFSATARSVITTLPCNCGCCLNCLGRIAHASYTGSQRSYSSPSGLW